jgi:hypothetical protein
LVLAPVVRSDLKERTKRFALDILRLSAELRSESPGWLLRGQLVRAGTGLLQEAGELTAILVSSIKTAKKNRS